MASACSVATKDVKPPVMSWSKRWPWLSLATYHFRLLAGTSSLCSGSWARNLLHYLQYTVFISPAHTYISTPTTHYHLLYPRSTEEAAICTSVVKSYSIWNIKHCPFPMLPHISSLPMLLHLPSPLRLLLTLPFLWFGIDTKTRPIWRLATMGHKLRSTVEFG